MFSGPEHFPEPASRGISSDPTVGAVHTSSCLLRLRVGIAVSALDYTHEHT